MRGPQRLLAALAAVLLLGGAAAAEPVTAPAGAPYSESVLRLAGDPARPVSLEVTLLEPAGRGPFPLAVINHGSPAYGQSAASVPRDRGATSAFYFLSRGYAVALPMMRGYAGSGGERVGFGCDVVGAAVINARDILAVIRALGRRGEIDGARVIVAGQSLGGWNTLALGTMAPREVRGLVNFAGGAHGPACYPQDQAMAYGAELFGARTAVPSIWFYGENDGLFPPSTWRQMFERYTAAGGRAELVDVGAFGLNAHYFSGGGAGALSVMAPRLDAFLGRLGLPHAALGPVWAPAPKVQEKRAYVRSGTETTLNFIFTMDTDCKVSAPPGLRITAAPAHGKAAVSPRTDIPHIPDDGRLAACAGKPVAGEALTYAPADGFVGEDALSLEETTAAGDTALIHIAVTVE